MNINQSFYNYIKPYLIKLREKIGHDFVVFGSAPLYLTGVVEFKGKINDLDISIKDVQAIPENARLVTFEKNPSQKFYKIIIDEMEIDIASVWTGQEDFFNKIHHDPIIIEGFKFANLKIIKEWKEKMLKKYNRLKDKQYLKQINNLENLSP